MGTPHLAEVSRRRWEMEHLDVVVTGILLQAHFILSPIALAVKTAEPS